MLSENVQEIDLNIDMETLSAPGAGNLGNNVRVQAGPITVGTTCWGTPCPSANTVSC
ncbi:hypothetical protein [Saccharopolyspora hattusasensis]|uniref:hypothetical protein n=1 Tax=Saccharopolyspora hattusasensis TaxID=1128679 RepID=UPI003D980866